MSKKQIAVIGQSCCFCGVCRVSCPAGAVCFSETVGYHVQTDLCIGCGRCRDGCRAHAISLEEYDE